MQRALCLIISALACLSTSAAALAYCDQHATVQQEFAISRLVFIARVTSAREVRVRSKSATGGMIYGVRAVESLKGKPPVTLALYSENSSGRFPMQIGTRYLVFVRHQTFEGIREQQWFIDNCGNSAPLREASKTLAAVRRLTKT